MTTLYKKHNVLNLQMIEEEMIHLKEINNIEINVSVQSKTGEYNYSPTRLKSQYQRELMQGEIAELKKLENKQNYPVFYKQNKATIHVVNPDSFFKQIKLKSKYTQYIYKRQYLNEKLLEFDKKIAEVDKLIQEEELNKSFWDRFKNKKTYPDYREEKNLYIDNYLDEYFKFFTEQFYILKLPKTLLDELYKATLIAVRFDVMKGITVLDTLIEKIYEFFSLAKKMQGDRILDKVINESVDDFYQYVTGIINKMKTYNDYKVTQKMELNETEKQNIGIVKGILFNDKD